MRSKQLRRLNKYMEDNSFVEFLRCYAAEFEIAAAEIRILTKIMWRDLGAKENEFIQKQFEIQLAKNEAGIGSSVVSEFDQELCAMNLEIETLTKEINKLTENISLQAKYACQLYDVDYRCATVLLFWSVQNRSDKFLTPVLVGSNRISLREIGVQFSAFMANDKSEEDKKTHFESFRAIDNFIDSVIRHFLQFRTGTGQLGVESRESEPLIYEGETNISPQAATVKNDPQGQAKKRKKSVAKGDATEKVNAKFMEHHKYENGWIGNSDPIGVNELARSAGVSANTAQRFFKKWFGGHPEYTFDANKHKHQLILTLRQLSGDAILIHNYGRDPDSHERDE